METTDRIASFKAAKPAGRKLATLTAYDYPTARLLEEAGIDLILVGDSLGMVVLGHPDTTHVTMDEMLHHCAAVARGAKHTLIACDLPFGAYDDPACAVANARRLAAAGAHAVKLEGARIAEVNAIVAAGIPVMGHLGMLPQHVLEEGGYKQKGKSREEAERLLDDARDLEKAGVFSIVLEIVVPRVAEEITRSITVPTIGIGSGAGCDGQILVTPDLVGLFPWFRPKFVQPEAELGGKFRSAIDRYIQRTRGA